VPEGRMRGLPFSFGRVPNASVKPSRVGITR
jgi:hypothetical protein